MKIAEEAILCDFSDVLPLLPGLQLNRPEVEDPFHDERKDAWADVNTYCCID